MEGSKISTTVVELPTGVLHNGKVLKNIKIREMAGPEEDILASDASSLKKINEILLQCLLDFDGITTPQEIRALIQKMVASDRWFYLIKLRCLTLGNQYESIVTCPSCGNEEKQTFDLQDLKVSKPILAEQTIKEIVLPSSTKIRFKALDGKAEEVIERLTKSDNKVTVGLFARVLEVNDQPADLLAVKTLSMKDRSAFRKEIELLESDIEDVYNSECSKCYHKHDINLSIEPKSFFGL